MIEFFSKLLDSSDFPARWTCGRWSSGHGWLHIVSDTAIFMAYMAIPVVLVVLITRRKDIPFPRVFWLFVAFIAFCGVSHLVEAMIFWEPVYRLSGLLKLGTATVSWATVFALIPTTRVALTLRSPAELEREVQLRTQELAEQKAMLEAVLASIGSGVAVADEAGDLVMFNDAAQEILGKGPAAIEASQWSEHYGVFLSDGETPCPEEAHPLVQILRGGAEQAEAELVIRDPQRGADRVIEATARPIQGPSGRSGAVVAIVDVTRHVKTERELSRSNQDLEQFAYAISHDLRAPLGHILMYSQLLEQELGTGLSETARSYVDVIVQGVKRTRALLDGLLEYSRIGSREVPSHPIASGEILSGVLEDLSTEIEALEARIEVGVLPPVVIDPTQLRQLFQNLLTNALKFRSDEPPHVRISAEEDGPMWRFAVQDNGIGIAPEHQQRVFGMFQRLHTREGPPGDGLGLALCQKIVTRCGGRIWIESEPPGGSTFWFTLPRGVADPSP